MTAPDPAAEALAKIIEPDLWSGDDYKVRRLIGPQRLDLAQEAVMKFATAILAAIRDRKIPGVFATGAARIRRLTRDEVLDIFYSKEKQIYLAHKYCVSPAFISNIQSGRRHKAITKGLTREQLRP